MKTRTAAAILCGILCLTSVPAYGAETDQTFSAAGAADFISEAVQEPETGKQESASPVLTGENGGDASSVSEGEITDAESETETTTSGGSSETAEQIGPVEQTDPAGQIGPVEQTDPAGQTNSADQTDPADQTDQEPVFSSGEDTQPAGDSAATTEETNIGWVKTTGKYGERWLYYDTSSDPEKHGKVWVHKNIVTKLDTSVMGEDYYLLNSGGYIVKNGMRKAENGYYYLSDANGVIYTKKLVTYNGYQYYVGVNGKRATWKNSWHRLKYADNQMYYFGSTPGRVVKKTGWQAVYRDGKFVGWYYFNSDGVHYKDYLLDNTYYFTSTGRLASGPTTVNGKMYFFAVSTKTARNGQMVKNGLVSDKNKWYYARSDGSLKKNGWQKVGDDYYYFKNYTAVTNTFKTRNGVNGYLDATGRFTTGWVIVDDANNKVKYIDTQTKGFATNCSRVIDGLTYYFDAEGYRINDVTDRVSGPYSLVVDCTNGVMTVYNYNRTIPVKSIRVSVGLPSTPTITGTFTLKRAGRWQQLMGNSWGQYASQISGNYLIHSIPAGSPDPHQVPMQYYYALGEPASHGCVRTNVADAKWVYDHCNGSTITIRYGTYRSHECFKGLLGRNAIVPVTTPNTDPTDPSV